MKDSDWVDLAQSTVALFDRDDLVLNKGIYDVQFTPFGESFHLCKDEPFYDQPSSSFCSGFLIGPKHIVTAGHCLRNEFNCERVRFAFGYAYTDAVNDPTKIPKNNVYTCKSIVRFNRIDCGYLPFGTKSYNSKRRSKSCFRQL